MRSVAASRSLHPMRFAAKGQLISKGLFDVIVLTKNQQFISRTSWVEILVFWSKNKKVLLKLIYLQSLVSRDWLSGFVHGPSTYFKLDHNGHVWTGAMNKIHKRLSTLVCTSFQRLWQKLLEKSRWFFDGNDDIKKSF